MQDLLFDYGIVFDFKELLNFKYINYEIFKNYICYFDDFFYWKSFSSEEENR